MKTARFCLSVAVAAGLTTVLWTSEVQAQAQCFVCVETVGGYTCIPRTWQPIGFVSCVADPSGCFLGDYCEVTASGEYEDWSPAGTLSSAAEEGSTTLTQHSRNCAGWIVARRYEVDQIRAIRIKTRELVI